MGLIDKLSDFGNTDASALEGQLGDIASDLLRMDPEQLEALHQQLEQIKQDYREIQALQADNPSEQAVQRLAGMSTEELLTMRVSINHIAAGLKAINDMPPITIDWKNNISGTAIDAIGKILAKDEGFARLLRQTLARIEART